MNGQEFTAIALWLNVIGFVLPAICALVKRLDWSKAAKDMAILALCIVAGAGQAFFNGSLKLADGDLAATVALIAGNITLVLNFAFVWYKNFWAPSGIDAKIAGE